MAFSMPWFMLDLDNFQLITSPTVPSDIRDTKEIVLAETPVPGLNYRPVLQGGGGNRRLSFSLQLISRNATIGNIGILKQFDKLRNRATGFGRWSSTRFAATPKVLYYWGTGSLPLVYWVAKADPVHKQGWVNGAGAPQVSEIEIELVLDEEHPVYKGEEVFRFVSALVGQAGSAVDPAMRIVTGGRPY